MHEDPPTRPPQSPNRTLTDLARYLILVEDKDPEEVAQLFERHARIARRNGPGWIMDQENREKIREFHEELGV